MQTDIHWYSLWNATTRPKIRTLLSCNLLFLPSEQLTIIIKECMIIYWSKHVISAGILGNVFTQECCSSFKKYIHLGTESYTRLGVRKKCKAL